MADVPILQLNANWRVAHDGRLQWILERRDKPDARSPAHVIGGAVFGFTSSGIG